ncbi:hypothetical protein DSOL_5407 [Desulfosporosinus metallidurans]|uniref:Uncharacterized protein n=1 Tax=Desulfosporosinus metallidurans TaxID=1888891 RepID=A0A1Q8QBM9_9FIRM|nr:hypothetical protein DSOL_5407 [Desulfosporosinus metallidurans]
MEGHIHAAHDVQFGGKRSRRQQCSQGQQMAAAASPAR